MLYIRIVKLKGKENLQFRVLRSKTSKSVEKQEHVVTVNTLMDKDIL